ncbi:MAG: hypothetical protein ABEJ95_01665 [Candidatus Nanohalobium sp.]
MSFKQLDKKTSVAALAFAGLIVVAAPLMLTHLTKNSKNSISTKNSPKQTGSRSSQRKQRNDKNSSHRVKLSQTKYAPYSYKISDSSVDQEEKRALAGFQVSKTTDNGDRVIQLNAQRKEYHDQKYRLKDGEQLYFIETSMGDDSHGHEYAMEDDTAVVVDSNGYIVRS